MRNIKYIIRILFTDKKLFFITVLFVMFVSCLNLVLPISFKIIVDYIISYKIERLLNIFAIFLIIFIIFRLFASIVQDLLFLIFRQKIERTILVQFLNEIFKFKFNRIQKLQTGDLINRITSFLNNFQSSIGGIVYFIFYSVFISITCLSIMYFIDVDLFLITLFFVSLHVVNLIFFSRNIQNSANNYYKHKGTTSSALTKFLNGYIQIITLKLSSFFAKDYSSKINKQVFGLFKIHFYERSQYLFQNLFIVLNLLLVLYFGSIKIINDQMEVGNLLFFLLILNFLNEPIFMIALINWSIQTIISQLNRIYEIIDDQEKDVNNENSSDIEKITAVKLDKISFSYENQKEIFKQADYMFEKNKIYMLTGESGIGKTTLFNLLLGVYELNSGEIFYNKNKKFNNIDKERILISLQDNFIFNGTVAENISCFDKNINQEKIKNSLVFSCLDDYINKLPYFENSKIEENGSNLSGGQKQRFNLARTIYDSDKSDIILFDEPTASLDPLTEKKFMQYLNQLKKDKIIIIISHKTKINKYCDEILTLKNLKLKKLR